MKTLSGKTALVTGGSRGIGAAIVKRLAEDGARVAFTYGKSPEAAASLVKELSKIDVLIKAYQVDAQRPEKMGTLVGDVMRDFGSIDILVNNAGTFEGGLIGDADYSAYERVRTVNVDSVFALTNAAVKHMKTGSRIINIGSVLGERAGAPGISPYNMSKFAVTGFGRSWAQDLGTKGILVNIVQPGPIDTDMNPADGENSEAQRSQIPLGRYGKPAEVAGVVAFLAGPDATFVNGARIDVDGGYNA